VISSYLLLIAEIDKKLILGGNLERLHGVTPRAV
jgi:hypothetical protein